MKSPEHILARHSSHPPERVPLWALAFSVVGGPLAWFIQLNAGYGLASWACFPGDSRLSAPLVGYDWSFPMMVALLIAGVLIALAAALVSQRTLRRTREIGSDGHADPLEVRTGRTRFLAHWGMIYGWGFALTTLLTCVAFILLPRCGG